MDASSVILSSLIVVLLLLCLNSSNRNNYRTFHPEPKYYISRPALGASLGNAANRKYENSQCYLGGCMSNSMDQEYLGGFSQPMSPEERYGRSGGGSAL